MTENDSKLEEELAKSLFNNLPIEELLFNFAEKEISHNITKPFLDNSSPLSFICACTCESLMAKSHFYSSIFLYALVCLERLRPFRLAYGHKIKQLEELFKNSPLANEPLYRLEGLVTDSVKFISSEINALRATEKILNLYSGNSDNYYLHPYKVYWFLVSELGIDKSVASRYHSTQGLLRLLINYLLFYKEYPDSEYPEDDKILVMYAELESKIKRNEPEVLPLGVDYEVTSVLTIIETFFDEFIKYSMEKNKEDKLSDLSHLTNMAIQILRLLNEYQSGAINEKMDSLLGMMDKKLTYLYNDLSESRLAKYYFIERWREKCKITNRYRPLSFLNKVERKSDISHFTIQELQSRLLINLNK